MRPWRLIIAGLVPIAVALAIFALFALRGRGKVLASDVSIADFGEYSGFAQVQYHVGGHIGQPLQVETVRLPQGSTRLVLLPRGEPVWVPLLVSRYSALECTLAPDGSGRRVAPDLHVSLTAHLLDAGQRVERDERLWKRIFTDGRGALLRVRLPSSYRGRVLVEIEAGADDRGPSAPQPGERHPSPPEADRRSGIGVARLRLLTRERGPVSRTPTVTPAGRPNVLIYIMDALRPDHLGCYGYRRDTSPNIDAFARDALIFENARSNAPWTRPSIASLLTGLLPSASLTSLRTSVLDPAYQTMGELLKKSGYDTGFITANGNVSDAWGFKQGWGKFEFLSGPLNADGSSTPVRGSEVTGRVMSALEAWRSAERPWLMMSFTVDTHVPYRPQAATRKRYVSDDYSGPMDGSVQATYNACMERVRVHKQDVEHMTQLYDATIRDADAEFGRLIRYLRQHNEYDDTLIVVTADHGEGLWEHHKFSHGNNLFEEEIRIPLLVKPPAGLRLKGSVKTPVSIVDILPTILAATRTDGPAFLAGADLLGLARDEEKLGLRPRFTVTEACLAPPEVLDMAAIVDYTGWKLIADFRPYGVHPVPARAPLHLYRLGEGEKDDLSTAMRLDARYYELMLASTLRHQMLVAQTVRAGPAGGRPRLSQDTTRNLRALGYLH